MRYATFLPRRLTHSGCIFAGNRLASHRDKLETELKPTTLVPKVVQALDKITGSMKDADPAAVAAEAWHEAYGELLVRVHDNPKDELHAKLLRALTSPYDDQAEEERRAEQRSRNKRTPTEPEDGEG